MRPVSGSISTSATCTPFGKVSGVSVVVLGVEVFGDGAAFFSAAARAAISNSGMRRSVPTMPKAPRS